RASFPPRPPPPVRTRPASMRAPSLNVIAAAFCCVRRIRTSLARTIRYGCARADRVFRRITADEPVADRFERNSVLRTHLAGSLRAEHAEQTVTLTGWVARRRDHGGVIFIDLRDASGVSQVVFRSAGVLEQAHRLRAEYCVRITGKVDIRPEGNQNFEIPTGAIEVDASELVVLN